MNFLYFKISLYEHESIKIEHSEFINFYPRVHFHPEYQLTYIQQGCGFLFVGDKISEFSSGDIFIIGPNIPHVFRCNDIIYNQENRIKTTSIFFTEKSFGEGLLNIPESAEIKDLLNRSEYGIKLSNNQSEEIGSILNKIIQKKGFERILDLLNILNKISKTEKTEMISLLQIPILKQKDDGSKINKVYEYVMQNYGSPIHLKEIASLVNMSHFAFCRFFKQRTNKTFIQFLNEVRIGMACKLLVEEKISISDIAYNTGFANQSNFIRQFKKLNGNTPSEYLRKIRKLENPNSRS